jgi:hypothetical protein
MKLVMVARLKEGDHVGALLWRRRPPKRRCLGLN